MTRRGPNRFLYIFLDEAGNLDFSPTGTKYFQLAALSKERPFHDYKELAELKYDLVEKGTDLEYFHASENAQAVRNQVFRIIQKNLSGVRIDALLVEKRKTVPAWQPVERFYPRMLGYLLKHILKQYDLSQFQEVIVFTDAFPLKKKREAIKKAIQPTLAEMLPDKARYRVFHHDSKSNFDLQIADYCNWAIYRKWRDGDTRSFKLIEPAVCSEFDIFQTGDQHYF